MGVLPVTDRLYYANAYLKSFEAVVQEVKGGAVRLDRSAFYPTSGGQPFDTGTLGGRRVTDVYIDDAGEVWHKVDGPLAVGARVTGEIDWARGHTIGLHLGAEVSTIDVELPGGETRVPEGVIDEIEEQVNRDIQADLPIRCWFPSEDELKTLPLRKPPAVKDHIRVVLIGNEADGECCACGGTHPGSAGQIGVVRVLDARPSRGKMRVAFGCGMRAFKDVRLRSKMSDRAAALLSAPVEKLPEAVEGVLAREREARAALENERLAQAIRRADALYEAAASVNGFRVVADESCGLSAEALREMAARLTSHEKTIALLESAQADGSRLIVFARPEGEGPHMGRLLSKAGGKGGGRPEFAQGGAPAGGAAARAMRLLTEAQ